MDDLTPDGLPHFADRLNRLIQAKRWESSVGSLVGFDDISLAARLTELGVPTSRSYINALRSASKRNPSARLILGLSHALGVSPAAWFDVRAETSAVADLEAEAQRLKG